MREDRGRNSRARQGAGKRSRAKIATGNRGNSAEPSRRIRQARILRGRGRTCARKSPEPVTLTFSAGTSTLSACPEIASQSPETESPFRACVFNENKAPFYRAPAISVDSNSFLRYCELFPARTGARKTSAFTAEGKRPRTCSTLIFLR